MRAQRLGTFGARVCLFIYIYVYAFICLYDGDMCIYVPFIACILRLGANKNVCFLQHLVLFSFTEAIETSLAITHHHF